LKVFMRAFAAVSGAALTAAVFFLYFDSSPVSVSGGERLFSIAKGESVSRIAERLQMENFIRLAPLLRIVSRLEGTEGLFKAGYYRIPPGTSTLAIHRLLVSGEETLEKITIPEGWTARKIGLLLESRGICTADEFLAAARSSALAAKLGVPARDLEGYLFPDTYFLSKPFPPEALAELMVKTFFDNLKTIAPESAGMNAKAIHERIILASIVEREYRIPEEAKIIASVFFNRLRANMGLESCATLEYIITEIQQKAHPEYITLEDKRIDSPYNTYKWAGLPPGPISGPGRVALDAAFHPARTDFLYFVLRDQNTGRHYFSRDLKEHNQAKYLYLKK
jgi:UPF0755 protein